MSLQSYLFPNAKENLLKHKSGHGLHCPKIFPSTIWLLYYPNDVLVINQFYQQEN